MLHSRQAAANQLLVGVGLRMDFFPTEETLLSEFYGAQLRGNFSAESHDGGCVGKCPLQFAARCRAWAKQQFAGSQMRENKRSMPSH